MPNTAWRLSALHCIQINEVQLCWQVFSLGFENVTALRETGVILSNIFRKAILDFEAVHDVEVVGFTTNGASNCRLSSRLLMDWRPSLITMDCCTHMVCNLMDACCWPPPRANDHIHNHHDSVVLHQMTANFLV